MKPPPASATGQLPVTTIRCREHGPLVIELPCDDQGQPLAGIKVNDHLGQSFPLPSHKRAVALCRCGHSATRPFCDGSHRQCGFQAGETAPTAAASPQMAEKEGLNQPLRGGLSDPSG